MNTRAGHDTPQSLAQEAMRRAAANDLAGAELLFGRLTELVPQSADAWASLGRCRLGLKRAGDALEPLRRAAELKPGDANAAVNHAGALALLGRHAESLAALDRAAGLRPGDPTIALNRGRSLQALGRREEALAAYDEALDRDPRLVPALSARAALLAETGDRFGALVALDSAIAQRPVDRGLRLRRAIVALSLGDWIGGLPDYELRHALTAPIERWQPDLALWQGQALEGRKVLLFAEARDEARAIADTLQLARFAPLLTGRAAAVTLEAPASLAAWFRTQALAAAVPVVDRGATPESQDLAIPLLSLPFLAESDPFALPPPLIAAESATGATRPPRRIGLAPLSDIDRRSVPRESLASLRPPAGTAVVLLQSTAAPPSSIEPPAFAGGLDVAAMAARLADLDLVIAADNWIAHLAGTLGVPAAILLDTAADWRWLDGRSDSPWYPRATLYRQAAAGDWQAPILQLAAALSI